MISGSRGMPASDLSASRTMPVATSKAVSHTEFMPDLVDETGVVNLTDATGRSSAASISD